MLPVGIVSTRGLISRAATGVDARHAVGQTGARPRIFCSADCGPRWQNCRISALSSVPKFGMPQEDDHRLLGLSPQLRYRSRDARLGEAAPGRRLALRRALDIERDERHQRRKPVAMIDVIAFFRGRVRTAQRDRRVEVVRIRVELVEQVEEIARRAGSARPQVGRHEIARLELGCDERRRKERGHLMRPLQLAAVHSGNASVSAVM